MSLKSTNLLFTVIVPTRNRADLLFECLQSIQQQSFKDFECIIIDDGSIDDTKAKVEHLNDARFVYFYQDHGERSQARNKGIELAQGDYLCFIDDDDLLESEYLSTFAQMINSPAYKNEILRVGYNTLPLNRKRVPFYSESKYGHPVKFAAYNMVGVWTLCIPKNYLREIRFPIEFPHWQDTYFILRLLAIYPMVQIFKRLYIYRIHENMGSRLVQSETQLLKRVKDNVAAIKDFESKHLKDVSPHLQITDFKFLYAEKYAQYAILAKQSGYRKLSKSLMQSAHEQSISIRLLKYYLRNF